MDCKEESSYGASLSEFAMCIHRAHQTLLKQAEAELHTFAAATVSEVCVCV